jgi:hypothetical protein
MSRSTVALFISPAIVSLLFGPYVVIAMPVMLVITLVFALPLFLIFRHFNWLSWWQSCLAGAFCGFAFAGFYWVTSPPYHIEYIGIRNAIFYVGVGTFVGILFWLTGVFRNEAFPFVSKRFPQSMYILVPIVAAVLWLHNRIDTHLVEGRVISILEQPQAIPERSGAVQLRLTDGSLVLASLPVGVLVPSEPSPIGQCFSLSERWSITLSEKLYFLHSPKFGMGSDKC